MRLYLSDNISILNDGRMVLDYQFYDRDISIIDIHRQLCNIDGLAFELYHPKKNLAVIVF